MTIKIERNASALVLAILVAAALVVWGLKSSGTCSFGGSEYYQPLSDQQFANLLDRIHNGDFEFHDPRSKKK